MKLLVVLMLMISCNKSAPTLSIDPINTCNQYKKNVLEAAVTVNEIKDEIVYGFKTNEEEATKFLKEYSTKHYLSQPRLESLKAVAEACTQDKIKQWQDSVLDEPCHYIFSEFKYFNGLINTVKSEKWSADTKALALDNTLEMIRFYSFKSSSLGELSVVQITLKSLVINGLIDKKIKPDLDQIENKLKSSLEEIQVMRKLSLTKVPSCSDSIYLTEYKLAQKLGKEISLLVKKI